MEYLWSVLRMFYTLVVASLTQANHISIGPGAYTSNKTLSGGPRNVLVLGSCEFMHNGTLINVNFYVATADWLLLQIWRPLYDEENTMMVVYQKLVIPELTDEILQVWLEEEDVRILIGDMVGFTKLNNTFPIPYIFKPQMSSDLWYHALEGEDETPKTGEYLAFEELGFPYHFSVTVTFRPDISNLYETLQDMADIASDNSSLAESPQYSGGATPVSETRLSDNMSNRPISPPDKFISKTAVQHAENLVETKLDRERMVSGAQTDHSGGKLSGASASTTLLQGLTGDKQDKLDSPPESPELAAQPASAQPNMKAIQVAVGVTLATNPAMIDQGISNEYPEWQNKPEPLEHNGGDQQGEKIVSGQGSHSTPNPANTVKPQESHTVHSNTERPPLSVSDSPHTDGIHSDTESPPHESTITHTASTQSSTFSSHVSGNFPNTESNSEQPTTPSFPDFAQQDLNSKEDINVQKDTPLPSMSTITVSPTPFRNAETVSDKSIPDKKKTANSVEH